MGTTLGEDFPRQQERCRKLLGIYREIGPAGAFAAVMIEATLRRADQAAIRGDVVEMLRVYNEMKEYKE